MNVIKKIDVFGDSILKGIQINPGNLKYFVDNHIGIDIISKKHSLSIQNFSKFGCTITKGYSLIKKRLETDLECDTIVMDFGGNDCDFDWKAISENPDAKHNPKTPINTFIETYYSIIKLLKEKHILPILTTLPPLEPQRFFDWFCNGLNKENILKWLGNVNTIYRYQENYSRSIEKIAYNTRCPLVDLRGAFLENRRIEDLLCEDGTHPNTKGQELITSAFLDFAEKFQAGKVSRRQRVAAL
jgi:lysophospholipase L1-like esterase